MLKYFKSSGYNVMWWGKNDLLAADAWESSVTSAMSVGGSTNYGRNPYHLLTQPEYYYRCTDLNYTHKPTLDTYPNDLRR